jgi:hypothetical protein
MFTCMTADPDRELISSIKLDVMTCLDRSGFFLKLDDLLCPEDGAQPRETCAGNCQFSEAILQGEGLDSSE